MRVLVVTETYWGNTARVADAIATELVPAHRVRLLAAGDVDELELGSADLVIVGAPTHVHGLPGPRSRAAAVKQGRLSEERARAEGVRELLARIPRSTGAVAAAFDTRVPGAVLVTGAASRGIARRLRKRDYRCVVPPESFLVEGKTPVLAAGELDRARVWARRVVDAAMRQESRTRQSPIAPASPV